MTKYTDEDKMKAIVELENNINHQTGNPNWTKVSKKLNISRKTLQKWWKEKNKEDTEHIRTLKKEEFIKKAWDNIFYGLGLLKEKAEKANYKDLIVGMATLIDKIQLLQGQPTEITKNENNNTELIEIDPEMLSPEAVSKIAEKILHKQKQDSE
ncbi:hypothetical protein SAMN02745164_00504 [Marinitoga hydrogenitolerans DSM 16785]|uniref:Uncharacterized protein n=1 Tax=Marinitoga hydrogenitolerans (strain DSM 16785 / JCM 12826 / AT1271) TaxID=1122195 RepID=A0A1M4TTK1_MARH1|nr:hypothetical protein [Marinitoga hydrogenitolerans]SHE47736.1 hypothetical protein SAMN02745164_00504 [Marinitoga hydrogenitolerans DSM 16785]